VYIIRIVYYIHRSELMKLNFCCFICVMNAGPYTLFKTEGLFTFICLRRWKCICVPNFDEISQSTAEIKLVPV